MSGVPGDMGAPMGGMPPEAMGGPEMPAGAPVQAAPPPPPPPKDPLQELTHAIVKVAEAAAMSPDGQQAFGFGNAASEMADAYLALTKAQLAPEESHADLALKQAQAQAALQSAEAQMVQATQPPEPSRPPSSESSGS